MALKKGYTLIEMMLTVAIIGILAGMAVHMSLQITNFWRQINARNAIQQDVSETLEIINRFTRQARGQTVRIDSYSGQPPCSRLSFTSVQGKNVSFYQAGNKLYMLTDSSLSVLSSNIAYIAFTYPRTDDISLISVSVTAQAATYLGGKKTLQLSIQKVRIMN